MRSIRWTFAIAIVQLAACGRERPPTRVAVHPAVVPALPPIPAFGGIARRGPCEIEISPASQAERDLRLVAFRARLPAGSTVTLNDLGDRAREVVVPSTASSQDDVAAASLALLRERGEVFGVSGVTALITPRPMANGAIVFRVDSSPRLLADRLQFHAIPFPAGSLTVTLESPRTPRLATCTTPLAVPTDPRYARAIDGHALVYTDPPGIDRAPGATHDEGPAHASDVYGNAYEVIGPDPHDHLYQRVVLHLHVRLQAPPRMSWSFLLDPVTTQIIAVAPDFVF